MNQTIRIDVNGTKALLTQMPRLPEGVGEPITLEVTFDPSWDAIVPRRVVLWREGDALLVLEPNENGVATVPRAFAATARPFYMRVTGREDGSFSTNELCASFFALYSDEATESKFAVPSGTYTLTRNGTYFGSDTLLAQAVRVEVPFNADTTRDTVTAETLFAGTTAHDAKGEAITGTYVNPFNADTTGDTVTAETLFAGTTAHDARGEAITGTYVNPFNADTTGDTVTAETLFVGTTAHDARGEAITGTYVPPKSGISSRAGVVANRVVSGAAVFAQTSVRIDA